MKKILLLLFLCSSIASSDEVSFKSRAVLRNVVVIDTILIANEPVITIKGKAFIARYKLSDVETIQKSSFDLTGFPSIVHQDQLPEKQALPGSQTDEAATPTNSVVYFGVSDKWAAITYARDTLPFCVACRLEGNMVGVIRGSSVVYISADSLEMLFKRGESHFWSGAGYGTLAGSVVGFAAGIASSRRPTGTFAPDIGPSSALGGAILGGVAGFTIGGIIGAVSGGDEELDLSQESTENKIKILRELRGEN